MIGIVVVVVVEVEGRDVTGMDSPLLRLMLRHEARKGGDLEPVDRMKERCTVIVDRRVSGELSMLR